MGIMGMFPVCLRRRYDIAYGANVQGFRFMPKSRALLYPVYLTLVSLIGVGLIIWGLIQLPNYQDLDRFFWLALLAVLAQGTATLAFRGVHFSVGSAISLATIPLYGPAAAALVAAASEASLWYISIRNDRPSPRQAAERLGFNVGMSSLAAFFGGAVFVKLIGGDGLMITESGVPGATVIFFWLIGATVADQVNFWLLCGILYLQRGIPPLEVWRENRWAIPINILVNAVGGGVLALSVLHLGLLGLFIFFLPIILSAYAFSLYARGTREQMAKLEELIELRTQALREANEELANLHKEKDAFLAVLTHDMRTPLTSIHGYVSLMRDQRDAPPEEYDHMLEVILRNEESLLEMVNNILEIQQLQSGAPVFLDRENFDLCYLVIEAVDTISAQAIEKNIRLSHQLQADPVYIEADRHKIRRVVSNLISNAIKYTPEGGSVCVALERNGRHAVMSVQDTGYGIPAEDLPHVFERFRRVRKHQNRAIGTGLGLAIVKSLVEAHDGEIAVDSREGIGSTFTVKLPL
jgi:signal transduction histidine kinase